MQNLSNTDEQKNKEEISQLDKYINLQKKKKSNLIQFLNNINFYIQNISDLDKLNSSILLLKNIKNCIDTIRNIISNLEKLKDLLTNPDQNLDTSNNVEQYNKLFIECQNTIFDNDLKIEDLISKHIENSIFVPDKTINNGENIIENIENDVCNNFESSSPIQSYTNIIETNKEKTQSQLNVEVGKDDCISNSSSDLFDNPVLLISEKQNKVFLPYKINDLKNKLDKNNKYKTIQEIIDNEYVIPYEKYKNPTISRFREGYFLMKNKEKASILDSLDLALELSFNSSLNPAIISACNNLNELDIYLDYLKSNELDKFKYFEIKYEILPQKKD